MAVEEPAAGVVWDHVQHLSIARQHREPAGAAGPSEQTTHAVVVGHSSNIMQWCMHACSCPASLCTVTHTCNVRTVSARYIVHDVLSQTRLPQHSSCLYGGLPCPTMQLTITDNVIRAQKLDLSETHPCRAAASPSPSPSRITHKVQDILSGWTFLPDP